LNQPDPTVLALLGQVSTAAITGMLYKKHGMRVRAMNGLRALHPEFCRFHGPAYTMRYVPQREDLNAATDLASPTSLLLRATEEIQRGAVLVVDMQGNGRVGLLGDVLVTRLIDAGAAGVVADGGMRDVRETRGMGLPLICKGPAAPPGPAEMMPAGTQEVISCGGVTVFPGDYVVGDEDGVAVIPAHLVGEVVAHCIEKERMDGWIRDLVAGGGGIRGRYPPNEETLAAYRAWLATQQKP
jgi:regulator of RNase E activity RraA